MSSICVSKVGCLLAVVAVASACGDRIKKPASSDLVLSGSVYALSSGAGGSPLSGAQVRAGVDRNADGTIADDEAATATTDDEGKYTLSMAVNAGEHVVVRFSDDGVAPSIETIVAAPWAELPLNATLRALEDFDCESDADRCALDGNKVTLTGLGEGTGGAARLFNPVKETRAFPGAFDDSDGNLLLSNAFTSIKLEKNGDAVTTLDSPAELRMRIPPETWKLIVDLHPGDDRIQIPLYAFNEASGEWQREGEGFLETSAGTVIAESHLGEIRAGTWTEGVTGCGTVSHFSYWNVDWPVDTKQCVSGVILGDDGAPAEGATVFVSGVTYTGSSKPVTVGADGTFCADVMRSEADGEDVDQDGVTGETQKVRIRIAYGGKLYEGPTLETPKQAATCGSGGCLAAGDLTLESAKEITPKVCKIHGTVRDNLHQPLGGTSVFFSDPSVPPELQEDLCGFASINCTILGVSNEDGTYELSTPVLDGALLTAFSFTSDDAQRLTRFRAGTNSTEGCPDGAVDIEMNEGYDTQNLLVTVSGNQISWEPNVAINVLSVSGPNAPSWAVSALGDDGFKGPVTYGTVPAGAVQDLPEQGAPPALQSGDNVTVLLQREHESIPLVGVGQAVVP